MSDYASRDDAWLLRNAGAEPEAFAELYDRHAATLHGWFRRRIAWAASDLTAETFAQAWLSRARFRDERHGTALPWLYGIAGHVLAASVRRDRIETRARERLGLPRDLAAEDGYAAAEQRLSPRLALRQALDGLPEHERAALELRVVQELSYEQVAQRLAIKPAAARLRVSRALRRLATAIPKEEL
ncbi:MAG TPA: sigma-70 family RNA polymerase sigma factor [Gaiellaceae bacterium]|nr:sigma-70 family RNA polymerase sigma factor [Gaiellaceae bacterium]